jgi:hypothetical protein
VLDTGVEGIPAFTVDALLDPLPPARDFVH